MVPVLTFTFFPEKRFSINSPRKEYMSTFKNSSFGNSNSILQLELKGFGYAFIEINSGKWLIFPE